MAEDYRVPVSRIAARVWLTEGGSRRITLFCAPGTEPASVLDDDRAFFPVMEGDVFTLVSRDSVVVLWLDGSTLESADEADLPMTSRRVRVSVRGDRTVDGTIRFVSSGPLDRTADFLNETPRSFAVHVDGQVAHISKAHVLTVVEDKT